MELDDLAAELEAATEPTNFTETYDKFAADLYNEVCSWSNLKRDAAMADATQRFSTALPLRLVNNTTIALIGAGGLGNWIWRVLLGMGFTNLAIFDDDEVGIENIGPQAHNLMDIGYPKVEAIRRAALAYRGVNLRVFKQRVMTVEDIFNELDYVPDIIIGATDSAEFRNSIIADFDNSIKEITGGGTNSPSDVKLFIDLRMSLGDWNAYITTPELISENISLFDAVYPTYIKEACFTSEEAVHEPCTARAITYTGANVASYVGAFLHWWYTEGRTKDAAWFRNNFYTPYRADSKTFNWAYTHSSRDFSAETQTRKQHDRIQDLQTMAAQSSAYEQFFKKNYCDGTNIAVGSMSHHSAYRGLSVEGHDTMIVLNTPKAMVIDFDEGRYEFIDMDTGSVPQLPVIFKLGLEGWERLAWWLSYDWFDKDRVDMLFVRENNGYLLTINHDGTLKMVLAKMVPNTDTSAWDVYPTNITVPLQTLIGKKWDDSADMSKFTSEYTLYNEPEPEPEPEPETETQPEPEQEATSTICPLANLTTGRQVLLNGDTYTFVGTKGRLAQLERDGEVFYVSSAEEVTCC